MSYMALYRKFRPVEFDEVKGQEPIVTTLKNQIKTNRIGHAYLFCGTRGTGKTTVAKIFARAVNCENPIEGSPCGACEMCKKIKAGTVMNVREIDGASNNGVDDIRQIVEEVEYPPTEGKYTVYIIDEAHMVTQQAFNALLKTLEEPPSYVIFIFATTDPSRILVTIHSRCQRYDFRRISLETISDQIKELTEKEGVEIEEAAARFIAKLADGSMRDALSLLDQCIAFHFGEILSYDKILDVLGAVDNAIFASLLEAVLDRNVVGAIRILDDVINQGRDLYQFVNDFIWYLRNLMMVKSAEVSPDVLEISIETLERLKEEAERIELGTIMRYIRVFSELSNQLRYSNQKRIQIEVAIIRLCKPQMEDTKEALLDRIRELEYKVENGIAIYEATPGNGDISNPKLIAKPSKPVLPKAVSEEIKEIAKNWNAIVEAMEQQAIRARLETCTPSVKGDNILLIVAKNKLAEAFLHEGNRLDEIKRHMEDFLQKEIEVEVTSLEEGQIFEDHYIDISKSFGCVKIEIVDDMED